VGLRVDGRSYPARYGLPRPDVAAQKPGFPDGAASGFSFEGTLADLTPVRHEIEYVATDKHGNTKSFGRKSLVPPAALAMWRPQLDVHPALARNRFHFLMMASAVGFGSAAEADSQYKEYVSRTQKVGVSVPILYLRTTTGASGDWQFDPEFDLSRKCGNRLVAEDNLAGVMRFAIK